MITSRIEAYITTWEGRCYSDGIPDEIPAKLAKSFRVPSYKAIALAILNNDAALKSLGFEPRHSQYYELLKGGPPELEIELQLELEGLSS